MARRIRRSTASRPSSLFCTCRRLSLVALRRSLISGALLLPLNPNLRKQRVILARNQLVRQRFRSTKGGQNWPKWEAGPGLAGEALMALEPRYFSNDCWICFQ